ncbi:RHS repeat domain-containing protein [Chloroflexota bacterium]
MLSLNGNVYDDFRNLATRESDNQTETFGYDFLDRLTSVSGAYSISYTYNEIGNILSKGCTSYSYDTTQPHAVDTVDSTSYQYDNNGNMEYRSSDNRTIEWDAENRPVSILEDGDEIASFIYDGDGNRVWKSEGGEEVLYINKYYEKELNSGNETVSYYLGSRLKAQREEDVLRYVHQDHLTGTSMMSDSEGVLISSIKYLPFGDTLSGSVPTDKLFTGQRFDPNGLHYYNARYC